MSEEVFDIPCTTYIPDSTVIFACFSRRRSRAPIRLENPKSSASLCLTNAFNIPSEAQLQYTQALSIDC